MSVGQISIRHAEERDAEAIRSIYNYEVEHETATFDLVPRSLDDQLEWQRARTGAFCVYVAELDGEVVGFGALSPYKERAAYRTSVEDSVYVRRDLGRQGIGRPCSPICSRQPKMVVFMLLWPELPPFPRVPLPYMRLWASN